MDNYRDEVISFMKAVEGKEVIVFDTETTGFSPVDNDIIEFSAIKYAVKEGKFLKVDELDLFINPGYPIPQEITDITGITDAKVKDAPYSLDAARIIRGYLGENPILAGYNSVQFDQAFLNALYRRAFDEFFRPSAHLDIFMMAKEKVEGAHKLEDMAKLAGIPENLHFHSSIDDAKATFEVLQYLLPMYKEKEVRKDINLLEINRISRWKKSETLDRIYVGNTEELKIFYNVVSKEWVIPGPYEPEEVIQAIRKYANVLSDDALVEKFN